MKSSKIFLPALILAAAVLSPALRAQSLNPDKPTNRFGNPTSIAHIYQNYIYGVIKKIDKKRHELIVDKTVFGNGQTFKLEPKTKYIHNRKRSTLDALKVGEQVYIDMSRNKKTGDMIARKVVTGIAATGGV